MLVCILIKNILLIFMCLNHVDDFLVDWIDGELSDESRVHTSNSDRIAYRLFSLESGIAGRVGGIVKPGQ